MFPEYRELISRLKTTDRHFEKLFNKHNELDQKIKNIETGVLTDTSVIVEELKKEKLKLKDEMHQMLRQYEQ
ncbi:YdcH family protein [Neisseria sp. Ec49-e6-T10]|uniref:YdcH family protein n=1 Tax=Neisseria sp. Ec49-e6-T10 TaxID=3140744 RepID=UPI003EB72972